MRVSVEAITMNAGTNAIYATAGADLGNIAGPYVSGALWLRALNIDCGSAIGCNGVYTTDFDGTGVNARIWIDAQEIKANRGQCIQHIGMKGYYTVLKLNNDLAQTADNAPAITVEDGWVWLDTQKISGGSAAGLMLLDGGISVMNVGEMIDPNNQAGYLINAQDGDHVISCPKAVGGSTSKGLFNAGATVRFSGRINTSASNATRPVEVSGTTQKTFLDGATLVANAAMESIYAGSAKNVKILNTCFANKAKHANITTQIGTLVVDANVE